MILRYTFLFLLFFSSGFSQDPPSIHGFEMSNLRIPYQEIKRGGPPKDGIPSIDQPKFVKVHEAEDFLYNKDYVIGLEIDGVAKAYPVRILNYHEVVNDQIGSQPVVVTYCPLCGSGAVFSAIVEGKHYTFGVSGLLYNSDVLLYDRESESLWSQLQSEAISGAASSKKLELIASTFTTFKNWKNQYPNSLVLSTDTGANRNYDTSPYHTYNPSEKLLFPVSQTSKKMHRGAKVIGIELGGQFKAYSLKKLKKLKAPLQDVFNNKKLIIEYDRSSRSATIKDESGKLLPSITLYWFAWYTFHPETQVWP